MKFIDFFRKVDGLYDVSDENIRLVKQYIYGVTSKFNIKERAL